MDNLRMGAELIGEVSRVESSPVQLQPVGIWHRKSQSLGNGTCERTDYPINHAFSKQASHLIRGDFTFNSTGEARHLLAGATSFFRGLKHQYDGDYQEGLQSVDDFQQDWGPEGKSVFMFSGCKDEQTSADAFINGRHVGESFHTS